MLHTLINGVSCRHLPVIDRGLHYGDGLFETIACVDDGLQFWDEHIARMLHGAECLGIDPAAINYFNDDVTTMLQQHGISNGVIKLMLTRGQGERGYRSPLTQKTTRVVIITDLPEYPGSYITEGICACFCQYPISKNPRLAGIKHLNRLDNVLARSEWQDEYQEGLMLDDTGNIVEGTMSNVFAVSNGKLFTPSLNYSGVDGIIRKQVLSIAQAQGIKTNITDINKEELIRMDEIFICNSLIGIWPVSSLDDANYKVGSITQSLFESLQQQMRAQ
ncbi:MAG: aminodeoxychorismate lyase [Gammaproteobacteria bacterium]|nr:aminodeoxychorismate lyase [Gammaproteobacteria bacterium]MCW8923250.1 aminodeoxychorismate lyase [Gammaproteobacteria bacterium]